MAGKEKKNSFPAKSRKAASKLPSVKDPTSRYMMEMSKYPLLSREEEFKLAKKLYDNQDQDAAKKLVTANLRFVVRIASEYTRFGLRLIDLIQEGNLGLLIAVKKFNPYRGTRLTTYAVWWIRSYIHDYMLQQWSMVKIGTTTARKKLFYKLKQEQEKLKVLLEHEHYPKLLEHRIIADKLGVKEDEVAEMEMRLQGGDISLDAPIGDGATSASFLDILTDNNPNAEDMLAKRNFQEVFNKHLESFIETLNKRDREILETRLMSDEPLNLREIGEKYNISRERVRQLEERIKKNLKDFIIEREPDFKEK